MNDYTDRLLARHAELTEKCYPEPERAQPGTPAFDRSVWALFDQAQKTLLTKHRDYGPKNISDSPGGPITGIRVRMHDKVSRINHLLDNVREPEHESLEDSFLDLANYALIAVLVLRGQWPS